MKLLAIFGAGGHGRVVAEAAELSGWKVECFFDDIYSQQNNSSDIPIVGNLSDLMVKFSEFDGIHVAIGDNNIRLSIINTLQSKGVVLATIIHPSASISKSAKVKEGSSILANASVNSNALIGVGNILNTNCSVDHDCTLGDGVHISPGVNIAGNVLIGDRTWLGIGSMVIQSLQIGKDVIVGAGSNVLGDISDSSIAYGNPCKVVRKIKKKHK